MQNDDQHCDVLIAGGGAAGLAAAVAAARAGARTILLEKQGFFGGLAASGAASAVCGLYPRHEGERPSMAVGLFAQEFAERLAQVGRTSAQLLDQGLWVLPYEPWAFRLLADELIGETQNLTPVLRASITAAHQEAGRVVALEAFVGNRLMKFHPRYLIDCTGAATSLRLLQAPVVESVEQAAAAVFAMDGVDEQLQTTAGRLSVLRTVYRAADSGRLPNVCRTLSFAPGQAGPGTARMKMTLADEASEHWRRLTKLETGAREIIAQLHCFLIKECPAFKQAGPPRGASFIGVRDGWRAQGRAELTEEDVRGCRKFAEGVARGCWPIEEWRAGDGRPKLGLLPENDYYEIPLGCLQVQGLENALVAGRCLSATAQAMASARVIGTALDTGWAAGVAAAKLAEGLSMADVVAFLRSQLP